MINPSMTNKNIIAIFLIPNMDRINKFLDSRQKKHIKTVKYKDEKFQITKEDLKKVRAYRSSRCLDPSIRSIPNRIITDETLEPLPSKIKKDYSDIQNKRLKEHYKNNPQPKTIEYNKMEDIWGDEDLTNYVQEWTYSIDTPYEGRIEELKFTKENLEEELRRVYLRQFKPRDPKFKLIKDILPKLPDLESMRPYPEEASYEWSTEMNKVVVFRSKMCLLKGSRVILKDMKYNKVLHDVEITNTNSINSNNTNDTNTNMDDDKIICKVAYNADSLIVSSKYSIFLIENGTHRKILESKLIIKDIYIDQSLIAYLTSKSIHIYDFKTLEELKIIKLKGDSPHSIKILNDTVYASTHKGIMVDSIERSEIKNLGYVIDFEIYKGEVYSINNVNRLMRVDKDMNIVGNTVQNQIGSEIRIHERYDLIAILFSNEIGIYKIMGDQCIPVNTIVGTYKSIGWDEEMSWLYGINKKKAVLFT